MDLYSRLQPLLDDLPDKADTVAAQLEPLKLAIVGIPNSVRPTALSSRSAGGCCGRACCWRRWLFTEQHAQRWLCRARAR